MKSSEIKELREQIQSSKEEIDNKELQDKTENLLNKFNNKVFKASTIWASIALVVLILISAFYSKIRTLGSMTSQAIFSNGNFGVNLLIIFLVFIVLINLNLAITSYLSLKGKKFSNILNYIRNYEISDSFAFLFKGLFLVWFILIIIITPCTVSGDSMNATFTDGDRVILWHINYTPTDNDVVVVKVTDKYENIYQNDYLEYYIKRMVATSGQKVTLEADDFGNYKMYVEGNYIETVSYLDAKNMFGVFDFDANVEFIVPDGKCLVFGDNRNNSFDSRKLGMIDNSDVVGKVVFRIFPNIGVPTKKVLD